MRRLLLVSLIIFPAWGRSVVDTPPQQGPNAPSQEPLEVKLNQVRFKYQPPNPRYPEEASKAGISGNVSLVITVDKEGKVTLAKAVSGPPELFDASEKYWSKHLFFPYMKDGAPRVIRFTVTAPWRLRK